MKVKFTEIRRRREAMGLTQADAAKKAGWSRHSNWSNVENGAQGDNLKLATIVSVCKVLKCRIDDLVKY